jgi:hypothetical protein
MSEQMEPVLNVFMEKYPNIKVNSFRAAGEELAATMDMELAAGNPQFEKIDKLLQDESFENPITDDVSQTLYGTEL